jgi:hypothetical protein
MNRLALHAGIREIQEFNERGRHWNWNIVLTGPVSGGRLGE